MARLASHLLDDRRKSTFEPILELMASVSPSKIVQILLLHLLLLNGTYILGLALQPLILIDDDHSLVVDPLSALPISPVVHEEDKEARIVVSPNEINFVLSPTPHKSPRVAGNNSEAEERRWGYNGDLYNAGTRTTTDLNKTIAFQLTKTIKSLVHAKYKASWS